MYKLYKNLLQYLAIFFLIVANFALNFAFAENPLTIVNVTVEILENVIVISWDTNLDASGRIDYAKESYYKDHDEDENSYSSFVSDASRKSTHHSISLFGLQPDEKYHFQITVRTNTQEVKTFDRVFETDDFIDNTIPIISDVRVIYVTGKTATIQWQTNEDSDSQVLYGTTREYGKKAGGTSKTKVHEVIVKGLKLQTVYHFTVKSKDKDGNVATYSDDTFVTDFSENRDKEVLRIFDINPINSNDPNIESTRVIISWRTSRPADGTVRYGRGERLEKSAKLSPPKSFFHSVVLTDLLPGQKYTFDIQSKDVLGKTFKTDKLVFVTRDENGVTSFDNSENENVYDSTESPVISPSPTPEPKPTKTLNASKKTKTQVVVEDPATRFFGKDGVIFYSSFDEHFDADISAGDSVGYAENGRIHNKGVVGKSASFNKGGFVRYTLPGNLNTNEGTIAFWYKSQWGKNDTQVRGLFTVNRENENPEKYFQITKEGLDSIIFSLEDDIDQDFRYSLTNLENVNAGKWHFVAVTWEYNGGQGNVYFDNIRKDTESYVRNGDSADLLLGTPDLGSHFYIGTTSSLQSPVEIDELLIFDRQLDEEDINELFQRGAQFFLAGDGSLTIERPAPLKPRNTKKTYDTTTLQLETEERVLGDSNIPEVTKPVSEPVKLNLYTLASRLIKSVEKSDIFAIVKGKKHYITSPTSFELYGYDLKNVETVSEKTVLLYPDARLLKTPDDSAVYYMYKRDDVGFLKMALPSSDVFESYKNNKWQDVITVHALDLNVYKHAWLVRVEGDQTIYFLDNRVVRPFVSESVFEKTVWDFNHVVEINQLHFNSYTLGETIDDLNVQKLAF